MPKTTLRLASKPTPAVWNHKRDRETSTSVLGLPSNSVLLDQSVLLATIMPSF